MLGVIAMVSVVGVAYTHMAPPVTVYVYVVVAVLSRAENTVPELQFLLDIGNACII
mgnify:CR=1 FL=1